MIMARNYTIGVDLGGTNLRVAAYIEGLDFLEVLNLPTRLVEGRDRVITDMREAIQALMARGFGELIGIGVGTPGPLELPEGILRNPPNLLGWDGFEFRRAIESALGRRIELENDANLAALAECTLGAGRTYGCDSLCMLTLGTGVGSGLVLQGDIWSGFSGMGGEAGHIIVEPHDGVPCGCGGSGCLEQYASATAIVRMMRERCGPAELTTAHDVYLLAQAGDAEACSVFSDVGEALGITFTALINTLNLPLYLLGGGVCEALDLFAPNMYRVLRERSYIYRLTELGDPTSQHHTRIQQAELGPRAGLLGACLLPLRQRRSAVEPELSVT
jgi:glucokinase